MGDMPNSSRAPLLEPVISGATSPLQKLNGFEIIKLGGTKRHQRREEKCRGILWNFIVIEANLQEPLFGKYHDTKPGLVSSGSSCF